MSSASDYMTGSAPSGASYAAPLVGQQLGQTIAGYPDAYMKGVQNRRTLELQKPILGPDGQPTTDYQTIAQELLRRGGGEYAEKMMPFLYGSQADQGITNVMMGQPPSNSGPGATANATGPANLRPQSQSAPAQAAPQGGPKAPPQGQPQLSTGADNSGQDTLRSVATELSGGKDITPVIGTAARVLRINPDAPLTPAQSASVKTFIGNAVRGGPQAPGIPQPPQPGQAQAAQPQPQARAAPAGQQTAQNDDPTLGGLIPESWAAQGRTPSQYRDVLAAVASRMGVSPNAKDAALARIKAIDDYMAKSSQTEYEAELKNKALTPEQKNAQDQNVTSFELKKEQNKNDVDRFGKQYDSISKIGDQADETIPQLDLAKRLVNDPNFVSGSLAPGSDMMKRLSVAVGMDPNTATPDQLFDKIRAGSILNQIKGMAGTGPVRVAEMKFIDQMIAGRENTPSTLRTLLEIESRLYQRAQAVRDMANNYHNGHLDNGFDKKVAEYKNQTPMFSKDELKDPRLIAPPAPSAPPPPFPANATPEQKIQQARAYGAKMGLKPGDPFKTPNGIKYVP